MVDFLSKTTFVLSPTMIEYIKTAQKTHSIFDEVLLFSFVSILRYNEKLVFEGVALTWLYSIGWNLYLLFLPNGVTVEGFGTHCAPNWFSSSDRLIKIITH